MLHWNKAIQMVDVSQVKVGQRWKITGFQDNCIVEITSSKFDVFYFKVVQLLPGKNDFVVGSQGYTGFKRQTYELLLNQDATSK
jgi:hypothetical protein